MEKTLRNYFGVGAIVLATSLGLGGCAVLDNDNDDSRETYALSSTNHKDLVEQTVDMSMGPLLALSGGNSKEYTKYPMKRSKCIEGGSNIVYRGTNGKNLAYEVIIELPKSKRGKKATIGFIDHARLNNVVVSNHTDNSTYFDKK